VEGGDGEKAIEMRERETGRGKRERERETERTLTLDHTRRASSISETLSAPLRINSKIRNEFDCT
jgi:hypothetical protein